MVRWRYCLFLAMLLILPNRAGSKEDDEDESRGDDNEEEEEEEDDDDDEQPSEKLVDRMAQGRKPQPSASPTVAAVETVTRTAPRRPLECYVCAYKAETQLRSCLDPTKYRVHTMICHSAEDKCFTSVISKGTSYEAVMRGCRSGCVGNTDTTCCELNRCNNQALAMPVVAPHVLTVSKANKPIPPSVLFFVSILLVLQTVVKVAIV